MRIISKWKDYYDGAAIYGIDKERIYVRKTEYLEVPVIQIPGYYKSYRGKVNQEYDIIGFCGEIFLFNNYSEKLYSNKWKFHPKKYILWEEDAVDFEFEKIKTDFRPEILKKVKSNKWRGKEGYENLKNSSFLKGLFLTHKVPIYYIGYVEGKTEHHLVLNPKLKDFAFAKFYDATQAFQRIEQFISNELASEFQPNIPTGGNEVLGRSKGFDEYSFRHKNTKKKPKKF